MQWRCEDRVAVWPALLQLAQEVELVVDLRRIKNRSPFRRRLVPNVLITNCTTHPR
jgi:hypothetical protein